MSRYSSRPSGRSSRSSSGEGLIARFTQLSVRDKVLAGVFALALVVFAGYYAIRLLGGSGGAPAVAVSPESTTDFEALRAMSVDELARERKKRADALEAVMKQARPPEDQLRAAREAAYRATVALHEKQPPEG